MSYARRRLPHGETLLRLPPALTMARVTFSTAAWSLSSSRSGPEQEHEFVTAHRCVVLLSLGLRRRRRAPSDAAERGSGNQHEPRLPGWEARAKYSRDRCAAATPPRASYTPPPLNPLPRRPCPSNPILICARARRACAPSSRLPSPMPATRRRRSRLPADAVAAMRGRRVRPHRRRGPRRLGRHRLAAHRQRRWPITPDPRRRAGA